MPNFIRITEFEGYPIIFFLSKNNFNKNLISQLNYLLAANRDEKIHAL